MYGPYEEDFTKCLNNYDHYMQFLSTQHIVVMPSTKHRCFYKMPKMCWWGGIRRYNVRRLLYQFPDNLVDIRSDICGSLFSILGL